MGKIRMGSELQGTYPYPSPDDYRICIITYFIYCDKCGSFNVEEHRTFTTWIKIAFGLFLVVLGSAALWHMPYFANATIMGVIGCLTFAFIVSALLKTWDVYLTGAGHLCNHCGNTDITDKNVLNFQEEDGSVIDISERFTHQHYESTYA